MSPSPLQILIILLIGVMLFGKRLPEIGRSLGEGLLELKRGMNEGEESPKGKRSETSPKSEETNLLEPPRPDQSFAPPTD